MCSFLVGCDTLSLSRFRKEGQVMIPTVAFKNSVICYPLNYKHMNFERNYHIWTKKKKKAKWCNSVNQHCTSSVEVIYDLEESVKNLLLTISNPKGLSPLIKTPFQVPICMKANSASYMPLFQGTYPQLPLIILNFKIGVCSQSGVYFKKKKTKLIHLSNYLSN